MWKRLIVLGQVVVALGSLVQMLAGTRDERLTRRRAAECLLSWSLPINGGLFEIVAFLWHIARRENAEGVEKPAGDAWRQQAAVAHLAFGVLGVLSIRLRGAFWFATVIGQGIFLIGISIAHAREMLKKDKFSADVLFLFDILMSLAHIGLLIAYNPLQAPPRPRRWRVVRG